MRRSGQPRSTATAHAVRCVRQVETLLSHVLSPRPPPPFLLGQTIADVFMRKIANDIPSEVSRVYNEGGYGIALAPFDTQVRHGSGTYALSEDGRLE